MKPGSPPALPATSTSGVRGPHLQLAPRSEESDSSRSANRGHRSGALDRRGDRAADRRPRMARARLGRRPLQADGAQRAVRTASRRVARFRQGLLGRRDRRRRQAHKRGRGGAGYRGTAVPEETPGAAVRLRVPDEGETVVEDVIRGQSAFENRLLDDFVIARSDRSPLQLCGSS